jgi:hypothetical protein
VDESGCQFLDPPKPQPGERTTEPLQMAHVVGRMEDDSRAEFVEKSGTWIFEWKLAINWGIRYTYTWILCSNSTFKMEEHGTSRWCPGSFSDVTMAPGAGEMQ